MSNQGKKDTDDKEEMFDLNPKEVTLTGAPAVKEDFLMVKGNEGLNDLELHGLAAKGGYNGIEAIPEVEIKKAVDLKTEAENEAAKGLHADDEDPDKDKTPEQLRKQEEDKDKEDDEDELDLGKSHVVRSLAPAMLTVKADLPKNLVKALEKSVADAEAEKEDDKDTEAAKAVAEVMKSEAPALATLIQAPLLVEIKKSTDRIAALEAERDLVAFTEVAKSMPGDVEKVAKRLVILKKSMNTKDFDTFVEEQQGVQKALLESEAFKSMQGRGVDTSDAVRAVQAKAEAEISKSGKSGDQVELAKAITHILETDKTLADAYHKDMQRAAAAPGA